MVCRDAAAVHQSAATGREPQFTTGASADAAAGASGGWPCHTKTPDLATAATSAAAAAASSGFITHDAAWHRLLPAAALGPATAADDCVRGPSDAITHLI